MGLPLHWITGMVDFRDLLVARTDGMSQLSSLWGTLSVSIAQLPYTELECEFRSASFFMATPTRTGHQ